MKLCTVYVPGTFDLLHVGHVRLIQNASKFGRVIVGVNTDEFAARYKRKPVVPMAERIEMLLALRDVHNVVVNEDGEDSKPAILLAAPRYIVHGDDWQGESYMEQLGVTPEWLAEHGIEILYLPYTEHVSTTSLLKRANEIDHAAYNFRWPS